MLLLQLQHAVVGGEEEEENFHTDRFLRVY